MTVHFIGAGPGAPDLITVRGRDLIARCPVCLYAGSLVPTGVAAAIARPNARIVDTAPLSLDEIIEEMRAADAAGRGRCAAAFRRPFDLERARRAAAAPRRARHRLHDHAGRSRVRGGGGGARPRADAAGGGAIGRADAHAGARFGDAGRRRTLAAFAATGATLAIHLSIHVLEKVVAELTPFYGADCPAAVVYRASWPEERIIRGDARQHRRRRSPRRAASNARALILVGPALAAARLPRQRALRRRLRPPLPRGRRDERHERPMFPEFPGSIRARSGSSAPGRAIRAC